MTGDKAVELINEWLNLAKEVGDMNLNRIEYDETRYNYAMDRMDVIRQKINEYHEQLFSEDEFDEEWDDNFDLENEQVTEERDCAQCKYCGVPKIEKPCQDCNNNHFYQFLGLEGDENCFEEAKDINSKIIDS